MRIKRKWTFFLISSLLISTLLAGCNKDGTSIVKEGPVASSTAKPNTTQTETQSSYNSAFEKYTDNITELGLVMNEPTKNTIDSLPKLDTYKHSETEESMLIIPKYNGSKVTISTVEYTGERFIAKETLYSKEGTSEGYGLLVYAMRPEGIPEIMITVTYKNKSIDYVVATDGKSGNKQIEYLKLEPENPGMSDEGEVITPTQDTTYLEGLNLFSRYEVDFDLDGTNEEIQVYCQGSVTEDGSYLLDDGQLWTLVVKKGDKIYPLFEKSYIQLGGLGYTAYVDFNNYEQIHVLIKYKTGAGLMTYDCVYDNETGRFIRHTVYEAGNISILKDWNWE